MCQGGLCKLSYKFTVAFSESAKSIARDITHRCFNDPPATQPFNSKHDFQYILPYFMLSSAIFDVAREERFFIFVPAARREPRKKLSQVEVEVHTPKALLATRHYSIYLSRVTPKLAVSLSLASSLPHFPQPPINFCMQDLFDNYANKL